jgi:Tfp pilus assembly protein PilO
MNILKQHIGSIIMVGIIGIMIVFILNPGLRTVKIIQNNITSLQDSRAKAESLLNQYDKIAQSYNSITDEQKSLLEKSLPVNVNNVRLILELQRIAQSHSMGFKDVNVNLKQENENRKPGESDNLRKVKIDVTLVGSYDSYLKVLGDIEQSLRILSLRSVVFKSPRDTKNSNQYQFDLGLETYWLTNESPSNPKKEEIIPVTAKL